MMVAWRHGLNGKVDVIGRYGVGARVLLLGAGAGRIRFGAGRIRSATAQPCLGCFPFQ